jgi:Tol biopolymer transport system component
MYQSNDSKRARITRTGVARSLSVAVLATLALAGCGGGGGGGGSSGSTTPSPGGGGGGGGSPPPGGSSKPPVVFMAEKDTPEITELYMVTATGSIKVNGPLVTGGWVREFEVSANGDFVVYRADQDTKNRTEVYMVNLANPGASTKLNAALTVDRDVLDFAISPDSSRVLYRADPGPINHYELFMVQAANPGSPAKISAPLVADGWVRAGYSFSPDSTKVLYRADQDVVDTTEIFLANIANPGAAQQVNPQLVAGGNVSSAYRFTPNGARIAYIADQQVDERQELFSVSVATPGSSTKLNGTMTAQGDVCRFEFSHDSTRVAYCGDQQTDEVMELFLVSLTAPGVSQKLNPQLVAGGNVGSSYDFSADDTFIVYEAEQDVVGKNELYRVNLASPGTATKLNAPIIQGGGVYMFHIRPDDQRVAYAANQEKVESWELYEVDLANPGAATKLTPAMSSEGIYDFTYWSDGARILYSAAQDNEFVDLFDVATGTPAAATKLNGTLATGGDVWDFELIP